MSWGAWVALAAYVLVFCLGPFRRAFWQNWRFTVPMSLGGWLGWFIAQGVRQPGEPCWLAVAAGVLVGLGAGAACKQWLDRELGERA